MSCHKTQNLQLPHNAHTQPNRIMYTEAVQYAKKKQQHTRRVGTRCFFLYLLLLSAMSAQSIFFRSFHKTSKLGQTHLLHVFWPMMATKKSQLRKMTFALCARFVCFCTDRAK